MTDPISAVSAQDIIRQAAAPSSPEIQGLSQQFDKLMAQQPGLAQGAGQPPHDHSALGDTVNALEKAQHGLKAEMQQFSVDAPGMSMQEMTARSIQLQSDIAEQHLQFNAVTSVAKSTKSGLQTLIKNQ